MINLRTYNYILTDTKFQSGTMYALHTETSPMNGRVKNIVLPLLSRTEYPKDIRNITYYDTLYLLVVS